MKSFQILIQYLYLLGQYITKIYDDYNSFKIIAFRLGNQVKPKLIFVTILNIFEPDKQQKN